jgi:hypothetical protein
MQSYKPIETLLTCKALEWTQPFNNVMAERGQTFHLVIKGYKVDILTIRSVNSGTVTTLDVVINVDGVRLCL